LFYELSGRERLLKLGGGLKPRVVVGGDAVHLFLDRVADSEAFDEVIDGLLRDGSVGTRELLEGFAGLGVTFATEDRLESFGYTAQLCSRSW